MTMQPVLAGSYALLWALVAIQTAVLLEVLRRTVRLKREIYESTPAEVKEERLAGGTRVDFTARDLTRGGVVRTDDLRGRPSCLLFLTPEDFGQGPGLPEWLLDTFAGLKSKGEGSLYVLCDGEAEACSPLSWRADPDVTVLLDEGGKIRHQFLVPSTPGAVMLDEEAGISKYGRLERPTD
jgi:hypothetical protein